ncbi:OmpH family outer membrane protein [Tenacibaculum xiamenense]|uniref:OmpH family outer membrane protein n=1 Tax=Tenacibaculum xiamenense TaxID=1261553 RepID=UPI003893DCE5
MEHIKRNSWSIINSVILIGLAIMFFIASNNKERVVYIDNVKLYNEFNMTKELGDINEKKYKPFLVKFDSIVNKLKTFEEKLNGQKKISKKEEEEYIKLKRLVVSGDAEIQDLRTQVKMEINKKVWERLNTYVREFGKERNYDVVLGAQGQGNIMYSKEEFNVTDEFIEYANSKYEGN